jgi:hypothetical protein
MPAKELLDQADALSKTQPDKAVELYRQVLDDTSGMLV